ncbi:hypothetical protein P167DRAFT_415558 [Morchella conica CCBAS932]|uniref:Uncharacterized protein n=1 Tax=Morchella conica CCBAS932 TaxID=1392247 RepID=A0A3N4KA29_9PEZI|nr:hypothetical protein P167DRAFT_415558 [Morchella conica CCBAS932]
MVRELCVYKVSLQGWFPSQRLKERTSCIIYNHRIISHHLYMHHRTAIGMIYGKNSYTVHRYFAIQFHPPPPVFHRSFRWL